MNRLTILLVCIVILGCKSEKPTEVLVLPTLHGAHEVNPNYTYADLEKIIKAYNPDAIGVEIRPIDMTMNSDSLDVFYPIEMIRVRDSFPGKVTGIDFYNEVTKNDVVRKNMFTDTTTQMGRMKQLIGNMQKDSLFLIAYEAAGIPAIHEEQERIALNYSAAEFLKGEYDSLAGRQYRLEDSLYKNTPYESYTVFNNNRDYHITKNALELIKANPSKRILILVGANHRNRLVDSLKTYDSKEIKLITDLEFLKGE